MSEKQAKPSALGRKFKLFLMMFVVLLIPMAMDQAEVDRETVRMAGRIAAGITLALTLYGLFAKVMKAFVFVILGLITLVVLVCEGTIKAPRLHEWFAARSEQKK